MRALRSHQFQWVVTVIRKYHPPRKITVFVVWINNDGLADAMNIYRALGDCTAVFELFKLMVADLAQIDCPVPIPENHP
jgi:hypothetical protein